MFMHEEKGDWAVAELEYTSLSGCLPSFDAPPQHVTNV